MYRSVKVHKRVKTMTTWYLYLAAIIGGGAWVAFLWHTYIPADTGNDYLYQQQQTLTREIQTLQKQIKELNAND